ncbi:MAG: O-antigen ligase family protein [Alphaproteobacteria bacterium]|nr:O-antigen ligase family protein [Alphaproteobacteria bacterium]
MSFVSKRVLPYWGLLIFGLAVIPGFFAGGAWASVGIAGGVLALIMVWGEDGKFPSMRRDISIFMLAFLLTCGALAFNSEYPSLSFHMTLQLASIVLPLLVFSSPQVQQRIWNRKIFVVVPWMISSVALVLSVELWMDGPVLAMLRPELIKPDVSITTKYNRGISYIAMLSWPLLAGMYFGSRRRQMWVFVASLIPVLVLTQSRATMLAEGVAVGIFFSAIYFPRAVAFVLRLLPVALMAWPFVFQGIFINNINWINKLPNSWGARAEIWDYMAYRIMERPLLGWGPGVSYKLPIESPNLLIYKYIAGPASHPHNAFVQLWVEMGVPGLVLGAVFALMVLRLAVNLPSRAAPFAMAAWGGCLVLSLCAYDLWTDSFLAMFALVVLGFAFALRECENGKLSFDKA